LMGKFARIFGRVQTRIRKKKGQVQELKRSLGEKKRVKKPGARKKEEIEERDFGGEKMELL